MGNKWIILNELLVDIGHICHIKLGDKIATDNFYPAEAAATNTTLLVTFQHPSQQPLTEKHG